MFFRKRSHHSNSNRRSLSFDLAIELLFPCGTRARSLGSIHRGKTAMLLSAGETRSVSLDSGRPWLWELELYSVCSNKIPGSIRLLHWQRHSLQQISLQLNQQEFYAMKPRSGVTPPEGDLSTFTIYTPLDLPFGRTPNSPDLGRKKGPGTHCPHKEKRHRQMSADKIVFLLGLFLELGRSGGRRDCGHIQCGAEVGF